MVKTASRRKTTKKATRLSRRKTASRKRISRRKTVTFRRSVKASVYIPGSEKPYRVSGKLMRPRLTRKGGFTKWQVEHQSVGIGSLRKSKLTQFGYHTDLNKNERAAALSKAVKEYGALSTYRSLNAIAIYNKNTHPAVSAAAKEDRDMLRKKFF